LTAPAAINNDRIAANKMNALPKLVCSMALAKAEWNNAQLINDQLRKEF
jgi:hypothetical protein